MEKLSSTQIWDLAAQALHQEEYRQKYVNILVEGIKDKNETILDVACGTGFPSLDLAKKGFLNITCADADDESIKTLKEKVMQRNFKIPIVKANWRNIAKEISGKFDVVLCVDSSLAYVDSWAGEEFVAEGNEIFERISLPLRNFYKLLDNKGRLFIGVPRNNLKTNSEVIEQIGSTSFKGRSVQVFWKLNFDWGKRIKTWENHIKINGKEIVKILKSYLFTKEELRTLLLEIGFQEVKIISSGNQHRLYDDILIASK